MAATVGTDSCHSSSGRFKIAYRSKAKAKQAAAAPKRPSWETRRLYPYHCRNCGQWHLSKRPQP